MSHTPDKVGGPPGSNVNGRSSETLGPNFLKPIDILALSFPDSVGYSMWRRPSHSRSDHPHPLRALLSLQVYQ